VSERNDFFSFEEALDQLRLKEEELKRLVSEGEIRAFREGDTMKLRRTDVEHLKSELMGGEVVELGDSSADLVFEDDFEDPGMATEELSAADTLIDEDLEDLDQLDEEPVALDEEDDEEPAPVGPAAEPVKDDPLALAAAIGTLIVLLLAGPVLISSSSGHLSDLAASIAGMFGHEFAE
jgi:excisionase family DNA binding protein